MTKTKFEARIELKQFWDEDYEDEWWKSGGCKAFQIIGLELVKKGFTYEEALSILGECHSAVAGEYGG